MLWLFTLPFLLLLLGAALRLPFDALRLARRNARRADGSHSRSRSRREGRHAARLLWRVAGAPLLVMLLAAGGMRAFHLYAMPDESLARIFGEYHPEASLHAPDLEAWEEALEATRREKAHRAWREAQGLDPKTEPTLGAQLAEHWPVHLVFLLLLLGFAGWYVLYAAPRAASAYRAEVLARSKDYLHRDLSAMLDGPR